MEKIRVYESDDWQVVATIDQYIDANIVIEIEVTKKQFDLIFNDWNMSLPTKAINNYKQMLMSNLR